MVQDLASSAMERAGIPNFKNGADFEGEARAKNEMGDEHPGESMCGSNGEGKCGRVVQEIASSAMEKKEEVQVKNEMSNEPGESKCSRDGKSKCSRVVQEFALSMDIQNKDCEEEALVKNELGDKPGKSKCGSDGESKSGRFSQEDRNDKNEMGDDEPGKSNCGSDGKNKCGRVVQEFASSATDMTKKEEALVKNQMSDEPGESKSGSDGQSKGGRVGESKSDSDGEFKKEEESEAEELSGGALAAAAFKRIKRRAILNFPISRIYDILQERGGVKIHGAAAIIFMTVVLEYLATELCEVAGNVAVKKKSCRVEDVHVKQAIRGDPELQQLMSGVQRRLKQRSYEQHGRNKQRAAAQESFAAAALDLTKD